jgi:flagellar hook-length control protein FliK
VTCETISTSLPAVGGTASAGDGPLGDQFAELIAQLADTGDSALGADLPVGVGTIVPGACAPVSQPAGDCSRPRTDAAPARDGSPEDGPPATDDGKDPAPPDVCAMPLWWTAGFPVIPAQMLSRSDEPGDAPAVADSPGPAALGTDAKADPTVSTPLASTTSDGSMPAAPLTPRIRSGILIADAPSPKRGEALGDATGAAAPESNGQPIGAKVSLLASPQDGTDVPTLGAADGSRIAAFKQATAHQPAATPDESADSAPSTPSDPSVTLTIGAQSTVETETRNSAGDRSKRRDDGQALAMTASEPPATPGALPSDRGAMFSIGHSAADVDPVARATLDLGARAPLDSPDSLAGSERTPPLPDDASLSRQIVQGIRLQWRGGTGEARVTLKPEYLGEVTIALRVEQGGVTAHLNAETAQVRSWMVANEHLLREGLREQGLTLERLVVSDKSPERDEGGRGRQQPQQQPEERESRARTRKDSGVFEIVV